MAKGIRRKVALPRLEQLLLALLLLVSCDGTVYHHFEPVEASGWAADDTLTFVYSGADLASRSTAMEMALQVRYGAGYEYKDLRVRVETLRADTSLLSVDTLCCRMYDDRGRRLGSTAGTMYQNGSNTVSVAALCCDTVILKVTHLMGSDYVRNIFDIGVKLTRAGL